MVQKLHPWDIIWVQSPRLMWADHKKKIDCSSVHILRSPCVKKEHIFSPILSFSIVGEIFRVSVQYRFRACRFSVLVVDIEAPFKTILELTE